MTAYKETKKKFSLKDELFNKEKVTGLANRIKEVYPEFKTRAFINRVVKKFPELELKERIEWITHNLEHYIHKDYKGTVEVLLKSLPPELNPNLSDNDFGEFINAPAGHYVATRGCKKEYLDISFDALREMTKRFSVEGPIRYFLNDFPGESMKFMHECALDKNYHVRRLASEGTRPMLPWAQKIGIDYHEPIKILDTLYADKTRYVTRSVANHMNDISKLDADLVIQTLQKWQKEKKQDTDELLFIIQHSLRTLVKQGNHDALKLLGYDRPDIRISSFAIQNENVSIGDALQFSFTVSSTSQDDQELLIDYVMHFKKKDGSYSPKTFKIKKITLAPKETVTITKLHPLRSMSTKTLYAGEQSLDIQINGDLMHHNSFILK